MRIIIEADGNVIDERIIEPVPPGDPIHDAGPAPMDMLRRFGRIVPDEAELNRADQASAVAAGDEPYLNPLRAGQARARERLARSTPSQDADEIVSVKGGKAPSLPKARARKGSDQSAS